MARRRYSFDEAKILKYLKNGRGEGHGRDYLPWLQVQDLPSEGRSSRVLGLTTGRTHHFLSDLETRYFYVLDWADDVVDIREQYPLPREATREIAKAMGIKHPIDPQSKADIVMTTDFVITVRHGSGTVNLARMVKSSSELSDPRTLEKLELDRRYWQGLQQPVDWALVTEREIDKAVTENLAMLHRYSVLSSDEFPDLDIPLIQETILERLVERAPGLSYARFCKVIDEQLGVEHGSTLTVMRHLMAIKRVLFPLQEKLVPSTPIGKLQIRPANQSFKKVGS